MGAVWRRAWQDLRARSKSFVFLFVILTIVSGLINIAAATTEQGITLYSSIRKQLDGADIWLWLTPAGVKAYKEGQMQLPHATERGQLHAATEGTLSKGSLELNATIIAYPQQMVKFDQLRITDGQYLSDRQPDGIILDAGLKQYKNLRIGDRVTLTSQNASGTFTILGFEEDASHVPYPNQNPTFVFVTDSAFRHLSDESVKQNFTKISFKVDEPAQSARILNEWEHSNSSQWILSGQDHQMVSSDYASINLITSVCLFAFVLFAIMAGWLIISNLVVTAVLEQTKEIGILKLLGFTGNQVRLIYYAENLVVGLVSSIVGICVSNSLVSLAATPTATVMGLANQVPHTVMIWLIDIIMILFVIVMSSFFPARRASRILATDAFRFGSERPRTYGSGLFAQLVSIGLPLTISLSIKDLFSRPLRTITAMVTVLFSVSTITFALTMVYEVQGYKDTPAKFGQFWNINVTPYTATDTTLESVLNQNRDIDGYLVTFLDGMVPTADGNHSFRLMAQSYSTGQLPYPIQQGRGLQHSGEVIVGKGLLTMTGLHVGDVFNTTIQGKPASLHIVGQFFDLSNMGREAVISPETLATYVKDPKISWIGVSPHDYHLTPFVARQLKTSLGNSVSVAAYETPVPPEVDQTQSLMMWFSSALAAIALLSLFNSLIRSVLERRKDFGIFKSLGMRPVQVVLNVALTGVVIGVAATVVGVPLGVTLFKFAMDSGAALLGSGQFPITVPWGELFLSATGIAIIAIAVSLIPAFRAGVVRPVEVLRAE